MATNPVQSHRARRTTGIALVDCGKIRSLQWFSTHHRGPATLSPSSRVAGRLPIISR